MAAHQPTLFDVEVWKPVPHFEDLYAVSSHGKVKSFDRKTIDGRNVKGRILKQATSWNGYKYVNLSRNSEVSRTLVHRMVLTAFVGPVPKGIEACHNNGIKDDNRLENLRWGTKSENTLDRVKHGTHYSANKTHCPRGHELSEPNLVPSELKLGHRNCLSCSRARGYIGNHPALKTHIQSISDSYYEAIMSPSNLPQSA